MAINFKFYPTTNRVPGVFGEVDASKANTAQAQQRALIIGQVLSGGGYTANTPVISSGYGNDVAGCGGAGSMLAQMVDQYRKSDTFGELWLGPVADNGSGALATGTVVFSGTATAAGTLPLYIGGESIPVGVSVGDAAAAVAANVVATIAAAGDACVTSAVTTATVTLTARHKGLAGNDIDIRFAYEGALGGEAMPAGITAVITGMSGGTLNPVLTTLLANIAGDQTFDFIAMPYTDTTSLDAMKAFLNNSTGRWSWQQQIFGGCFTAYRGTLSAQGTFGTARNDQHMSVMGVFDSPTTIWRWAADYCANSAVSLRASPATPLQDVALNVLAPPVPSRFDIGERNTMLYDGVSTFKVDDSGQVFIDRAITTYQMTASVPDDSYLDVETMFTLQFGMRDMRTFLQTTFKRMIFVADGTPCPTGSGMCTSQTVLNAAISRYRGQCSQGLMQNPDDFAQQASAENAGNGLCKLLLPFMLANQLRQIAMLVQFTKP